LSTDTFKETDGSPRKPAPGFFRPDSASSSKSKVLNLAEIQDLNNSMAEDKRKRDEGILSSLSLPMQANQTARRVDKAKRALEKEEARQAKKTKIQEDKAKKSEAREAKEKKEFDEKKKKQEEEPPQPIDVDGEFCLYYAHEKQPDRSRSGQLY
jgi:hypothetical protein